MVKSGALKVRSFLICFKSKTRCSENFLFMLIDNILFVLLFFLYTNLNV